MREELDKLTKQRKIGGERALLQNVMDLLEKRWNGCAGFKVYKLQESGHHYTVVRSNTSAFENVKDLQLTQSVKRVSVGNDRNMVIHASTQLRFTASSRRCRFVMY
jgi:hypothetical protein